MLSLEWFNRENFIVEYKVTKCKYFNNCFIITDDK